MARQLAGRLDRSRTGQFDRQAGGFRNVLGRNRAGAQQADPVSYTHLDVYKRQGYIHANMALAMEREDIGPAVRAFGEALFAR